MKHIAILTQPMHINYGGMLQAYALSKILIDNGHSVTILNRRVNEKSLKYKLSIAYKKFFKYGKSFSDKELKLISSKTDYFIENYLNLSQPIDSNQEFLKYLNFDAYVVGSDQCWRPRYSPNIYNYFLDFLPEGNKAIKISYAASLGTDVWEFDDIQTNKCAKLIKKFDSISVREKSAINIIKSNLKVDAKHVLDPTLLLNKKDYISIVNKENIKKSKGDLFYYILDKNSEKMKFVDDLSLLLDLKKFETMPKSRLTEKSNTIEDYIYPSTFEWLRSFIDAKYVITDSFHGTVFSIIFNKPFISIANIGRGNARFESLLSLFSLNDRLITDFENINFEDLNKEINWELVNNQLETLRNDSKEFLFNMLNG